MKIHILSDLHIEFADFTLPETDADVLVLSGDIGIGLAGLEWLQAQNIDKPVVYVPGNHEYYHHDLGLIKELRASAGPNIHILDAEAFVFDGVRFLGTTLWTDFKLFGGEMRSFAMQHARRHLADFSVINSYGRIFSPQDSVLLHQKSKAWLVEKLDERFEGKTVVVSHHAPSFGSIEARYENDMLTPAFVSSLEHCMDPSGMSLWLHGHTHCAFDYMIHGVRVVCNPRGYFPYERYIVFQPKLVVEV